MREGVRKGVRERDVCKDRNIYISLCVFSKRIKERERERKRERIGAHSL